jgi:ubiquinone/menaquinone biosynthesis C-methylase UbiE
MLNSTIFSINIMRNFKDHFSKQSEIYAQSRPQYPDELFEYLASLSPSRKLAWDAGTGNGQAALSLVKYFDKVIATDASKEQIKNAFLNEKIEYKVATAEESGLESNSIDLITVATAIHWFNHDLFYPEVKRILKPGGIIAAWCYAFSKTNVSIDAIIHHFATETIKDYWPPERKFVWNNYADLPFPFEIIETPKFYCRVNWNFNQMINYLNSWSSTQKYISVNNSNPIELIITELKNEWGEPNDIRETSWELGLRVGSVKYHKKRMTWLLTPGHSKNILFGG